MTFPIIACTVGIFFFVAERLFGQRKQPVFRRGFWADVFYAPLHVALRIVINGTVAFWLSELGRQILPASMVDVLLDEPVWVQAVVLLLVLDLTFYVLHRLKHRWTWWWRLHETHHSSVDLDFFASVRFHPLEKILDRVIFLAPLLVLGPSTDAIIVWASFDVFFGMFGHSNLGLRLGPLKYVFVGPEMHRWHHVRDPAIRECNFANNFALFDWIFGTAYISKDEPADYGVDDESYPIENLWRQFWFAFRPSRRAKADAAGAASAVREAGSG